MFIPESKVEEQVTDNPGLLKVNFLLLAQIWGEGYLVGYEGV